MKKFFPVLLAVLVSGLVIMFALLSFTPSKQSHRMVFLTEQEFRLVEPELYDGLGSDVVTIKKYDHGYFVTLN